jgi:hypothetical protein
LSPEERNETSKPAPDGVRKWKGSHGKETEFAIRATASCPDGVRDEAGRMIIDPAAPTVTHLVIKPKHRRAPGRPFPLHLTETTTGDAPQGHARLWRGRDRRQRSGSGTGQGAA